jgi:hypothetical protein
MSQARAVRPSFWILLAVAGILLLASFGLREARRERERWSRGRGQSQALATLAATHRAERLALHARLSQPAASVRELADAYLPGKSIEARESEPEALDDGFRLRRGEIQFAGFAWDELRVWMEKAESQATPWRVTGAEIESRLDGLHGLLRVEALDKAPSAP